MKRISPLRKVTCKLYIMKTWSLTEDFLSKTIWKMFTNTLRFRKYTYLIIILLLNGNDW